MSEKISVKAAFFETLLEVGVKHRNIVVINADVFGSIKTDRFLHTFSDRHFDFGVSLDCPNLNLKIVGVNSGLSSSEDGACAQAISDIALMRAIPNMKVYCPADYWEAKRAAIGMADDFGPVYLRLHRSGVPIIYDENYRFVSGKGTVVREGSEVAIFAIGPMVYEAILAAELLAKEGVSAEVLDMCSIKPIDSELILKVARGKKKLFTVEDHYVDGGLGSAISEVLAGGGCGVPLKRIAVEKFGESGKPEHLYGKMGLNAEGIYNLVFKSSMG
ncbi:MAG: hypothetical protein UW03_C0032G0010 [Candidatus Peregrinibacteria bacterium GW2011_GWA2_43_8]|nr:MAG: hypothetical protein UW03_C0032G0010 [Candidatus Peregrinibacteria bacterium GW2011_GWA2_43_8]